MCHAPERACRTPGLCWLRHSYVYRYQLLNKQLPKTLLICFLIGLIPLVGVVPDVVYYRLSLIASLKAYVPPHRFPHWLLQAVV